MFFFVENTRSIPVSFPRWFRYFRIRIHQHHRFIGPRPRSKPWDVRVIVVSWNHPKHLRSSVGWNPTVGTRGFGMVWGVVGVRLGWLAPVNQKTTNVLLIEVDVDELSWWWGWWWLVMMIVVGGCFFWVSEGEGWWVLCLSLWGWRLIRTLSSATFICWFGWFGAVPRQETESDVDDESLEIFGCSKNLGSNISVVAMTYKLWLERTPPKINIEPENDGLEDDFPFQGSILRFHVNLQGCTRQRLIIS